MVVADLDIATLLLCSMNINTKMLWEREGEKEEKIK